jgi:hypothetical protein
MGTSIEVLRFLQMNAIEVDSEVPPCVPKCRVRADSAEQIGNRFGLAIVRKKL